MQHPSYSDRIYALIAFVETLGVTIKPHEHWIRDEGCAGRIDYDKATIWLGEPRAKDALMVVAHEAGHWWSYLIWPDVEDRFTRPQREWLAFHFGWWVLPVVDAIDGPGETVTVGDWYEQHDDLFS